MSYVPHTDDDRRRMLEAVGAKHVDDLFADVPESIRGRRIKLPPGMTELELRRHMCELAARNTAPDSGRCFLGAGAYDHHIPAAVMELAGRSEFYTSYTPYQPEMSQGNLQAIYEYQSMICALTGMGVTNASLYEGGTALYEAALMAERITRRRRTVVCRGVNPRYRELLRSYGKIIGQEMVEVAVAEGGSDCDALAAAVDGNTAAVIVQNPNFFGVVQDFTGLAEACRAQKALLIMSVYPVSLGILKTPGEMGADIACGEAQSLGIALQYGGPYLGFLAAREEHARRMPGRICGATVDAAGKRGFVLTLQSREQHIRRERATSNICTNQALCALTACMHLTFLGREGLVEVATRCLQMAEHAKRQLAAAGFPLAFARPTFNEFAVDLPSPARAVIDALRASQGMLAGYDLGRDDPDRVNQLLVAVTEKHTRKDIDRFARALQETVAAREAVRVP